MADRSDYKAMLARVHRKRRGKDPRPFLYLIAAAGLILLVVILVIVIRSAGGGRTEDENEEETYLTAVADPTEVTMDAEAIRQSEEAERQRLEEESQAAQEQARQDVVDSYTNLGLIRIDGGYLNVRKTPASDGDIIGKMQPNSVCEILGQEGDWYHISSGGVDGYISAQFVLTGEEARAAALDQVQLRAIVTVSDDDSLNIRLTPSVEESNIIGQALAGERYVVEDQIDGWVKIASGYLSADYVDVRLALNEARKMDLKSMAISKYGNLLISKVTDYLNVRKTPADEGNNNIIGKLPGKAAADILGQEGDWYKIKSGSITGYVSANPDYVATGQEAMDLAMNTATLMAIVNTDRLNVRKEPSTDSGVWTQISKEERYPVVSQLDGWVQIELDAGDMEDSDAAYISTRDNNVEVRYALDEAIKFSPLEEIANQQAARRAQIVNFALRYVGNPYVWGGTSLTKGADCSGFVQSVMKNFGISLPRVSRDQSKSGRAVTSSQMRPGDLIFYANSSGTVNHVAMYIGNGQIVHAASRRSGIRISTWNYRTPYRIRNVID